MRKSTEAGDGVESLAEVVGEWVGGGVAGELGQDLAEMPSPRIRM